MSGSADSHLVAPCTAGKPVELWSSGTRGGTGAPQLASLEGRDTTLLLKITYTSIQKCPEKSSNTKVCASICSDRYVVAKIVTGNSAMANLSQYLAHFNLIFETSHLSLGYFWKNGNVGKVRPLLHFYWHFTIEKKTTEFQAFSFASPEVVMIKDAGK